jgi:hypothetical protein
VASLPLAARALPWTRWGEPPQTCMTLQSEQHLGRLS